MSVLVLAKSMTALEKIAVLTVVFLSSFVVKVPVLFIPIASHKSASQVMDFFGIRKVLT